MSPLPLLASGVSTVSGGGAVPVVVVPVMELPVRTPTRPWEHPETHATNHSAGHTDEHDGRKPPPECPNPPPPESPPVERSPSGPQPYGRGSGSLLVGAPLDHPRASSQYLETSSFFPSHELRPATGISRDSQTTLAVYQDTASPLGVSKAERPPRLLRGAPVECPRHGIHEKASPVKDEERPALG